MARSKGRTGRPWRRARERVRRNQKVCWLCGHPIDPDLKWPHPDSFSVDHVRPLSMDEDSARDYVNLRAAHLRCNQKRGTGAPTRAAEPSRDW